MANKISAEKRARQSDARRDRNRAQRSALRTQIKKTRQTIADKQADGEQIKSLLHQTQQELDKAASKRLVHPNKAARLKSRLALAANKAKASA